MKTKLTESEISTIIDKRQDERSRAHKMMDKWQRAWEQDVWSLTKQDARTLKGMEQVVTPAPTNTVSLAMRLVDTKPKIRVPKNGDNVKDDTNADKVEVFLNTMWENVSIEGMADPIAGATWQSFTLGRHVIQVMWIKEALPEMHQETRLPFTIRTLDPRSAGTFHNGIYTEYGWHVYDDHWGSVKERFGLTGKEWKYKYGDDDEQEVEVKDFWWQTDKAVRHAVLVDGAFAVKPVDTNFLMVPIIEGYGDYAPLNEEEYKALSIIAPMLESWLYDCRLKSQMATGVLLYFWPFLLYTNEQGKQIEDITIEPGLIKALPPGSRIESVVGSPNSQLVQNMSSMMEAAIQQSSFPDVLFGKAPGDVQAGYGVDLLAQSARGRINSFRVNLERTLQVANAIILHMTSWPNVKEASDGLSVYGYSTAALGARRYVVDDEVVGGKYHSVVDLKVNMDGNNLQKMTFWLRLVEAGVISKRTFLEVLLSDDVPSDEFARIAEQMAWDSDEMKPKQFLYALIDRYPTEEEEKAGEKEVDNWKNIIKNTPFEQLAQDLGYIPKPKPPADGRMDALQAQNAGPGGPMPPMDGPPGLMPPGGPPGPPGGPPIQPEGIMSPVMGPEQQGLMGPEMLGAPGMPPGLWDTLMNQPPETLTEEQRRMLEQQGGM